MDEPFSVPDALTRSHLRDELTRIVASSGSTVVTAARDVDEAVLLSDRVVVVTNDPAATVGAVLDIGLPRQRTTRATWRCALRCAPVPEADEGGRLIRCGEPVRGEN